MTRFAKFTLLTLLLGVLACPGRTSERPDPIVVATPEPSPNEVPAPVPWEGLVTMQIDFTPPPPLDVSELPPPPEGRPQNVEGERWAFDMGPHDPRDEVWTHCVVSTTSKDCAYTSYLPSGTVRDAWRTEIVDGRVRAHASRTHAVPDEFVRCWYDSRGRIVRHQRQIRERASACEWYVRATEQGYDAQGGLAFIAEEDGDTNVTRIYHNTYEGGLPSRTVVYAMSPDLPVPVLAEFQVFSWVGERLSRFDEYDEDGKWKSAFVLHWQDEWVRLDMLRRDEKMPYTDFYERDGVNDYARVRSPDKHTEHSSDGNIETYSFYEGQILVKRKRYTKVDGKRRKLSVDELVPEVDGLVNVEKWTWTDDEVIVEMPDGRSVYSLDCSDMPSFEDLVDPTCPPPLPVL